MQTPIRKASLAHEVDETGEVVVYDATGNRLLMLNQIGAAVWLLIDGERSNREIARLIVDTMSVEEGDAARVEQDVDAFVQHLVEHGVVELH
jgi:hypothetical protein